MDSSAGSNLQRQHRKLLAMGAELIKLSMKPFCDVKEVRRQLASFSGTLRVHAAMEEEGLYPQLLEAKDPQVRETAERLHAELSGLYRKWDEFMERWPTAAAIDAHTTRFRIQLAVVLATLERRMRREDAKLYPLVEQLHGPAPAE